jgi:5-enolpyruvylshikimate-3-phosphate synthase
VLFSSLANGVSKAKNLLISEDVLAAIEAVKKLGIKVILNKKECKIFGQGINGYKYKKNLKIDAQNSGTLGRLLLGLLVNTPKPITLVGDESLSKRDFKRVSEPLSKFGVKFKLRDNNFLPLKIYGASKLKPIKYNEKRGSAQCKSSIIFAAMRTNGNTKIKAKKSRNHTELLCKHLGLPITIKNKKNYDEIQIKKVKKIRTLNYNIPSDISSSAFFIVLTALSKNSELIIKNVNINPSRIGIITILKKMGKKITFKNKKIYKA